MLRQNALLRRHALGNFEELALDITRDPAMLLWLNGTSNNRWDVNENYARELQELFCLGAGRGYSERDVRELARALTGFRNDWTDAGPTPLPLRPEVPRRAASSASTAGAASTAGRRACGCVTRHRHHPDVHGHEAVGLLHPDASRRAATARALARLYVRRRARRAPAAGGDPRATRDLYDPARRMVKPPVVQAAGMLRAVGRGDRHARRGRGCATGAGQYLFLPPNVSGWDDTRWLDTATFRARWQMAAADLRAGPARPEKGDRRADRRRRAGRARAAAFWGSPPLSRPTRAGLERYAADTLAAADKQWKREQYPVLAVNALRMLVATSPDYLTS